MTGRTTEQLFDRREDVHRFCSEHLSVPSQGVYYACYIPALDLVVLPSARAWPDKAGRKALRVHEWAHARGWRHPLRLGTRTAAVK
ncbi:hypothetical protein LRS10_21340 [Phenylobacterium sp. J426]|uniref:hypothetical protein n=1 Tax=Phenylobacterium sp. J426 TaxID=2898439 RepID=UPI002150F63F|nr:hypothetical protein [Phenylobacterium sp. J426]MCR5876463.1 hypothetical protein [Phenylobacterium sp. J426]